MDFFAFHFKETLGEALGSEDYEKKKTETLKRFDVEKQNLSTELNQARAYQPS